MNETQLIDASNIEPAELALLTTVIAQPELLDQIVLTHEDFAHEHRGLIFRSAQYLFEHDKPVTAVTMIEKLAKRVDQELLTTVCNPSYAQPWMVQDLARIVREGAMRRRMIKAGHKLIELSQTAERMDDDALAEAEKAFAEIGAAAESATTGPVLITDVLTDYYEDLEKRYKHRGELTGVDTGFKQLNYYFGGWRATDFMVIAARPSMGKTAFALQTADAGSNNDVVVIFSIEMGRNTLLDRLVSSQSKVPLYNIMNGRMSKEHWPEITTALGVLEKKNLYIDDNPNVSVPYVRSKLRKIARKMEPGKKMVVFLDYLQIMKVAAKGRSRTEEVGEISKELKAMAKELNCCIVALAQLSRGVEQRQDKHPTLSDIRESGQIEQDADVIMFLYRDEYYNPETPKKNVVEVIVGKNRNGPVGTAEIVFLKEYQKFVDLERSPDDEQSTHG